MLTLNANMRCEVCRTLLEHCYEAEVAYTQAAANSDGLVGVEFDQALQRIEETRNASQACEKALLLHEQMHDCVRNSSVEKASWILHMRLPFAPTQFQAYEIEFGTEELVLLLIGEDGSYFAPEDRRDGEAVFEDYLWFTSHPVRNVKTIQVTLVGTKLKQSWLLRLEDGNKLALLCD